MIFRIRFKVAGAHVHCRLFSAKAHDETFAYLGSFVVSKGVEFRDLLGAFKKAEFLVDDIFANTDEAHAEFLGAQNG